MGKIYIFTLEFTIMYPELCNNNELVAYINFIFHCIAICKITQDKMLIKQLVLGICILYNGCVVCVYIKKRNQLLQHLCVLTE